MVSEWSIVDVMLEIEDYCKVIEKAKMIAGNIGCLVSIGSMISDPHIRGGVSAELGYAGF